MEIKDLMSYFRVLVNPSDDISVKRIINVPTRGIGDKAITAIEAEAALRGQPMLQTIEALVSENVPKLGQKLQGFMQLITALRAQLLRGSVDAVLETLLNAVGYLHYIEKKFPEQAIDKIENIHELGAALADFAIAHPEATIAEWLQSVTLSSSEGEDKGGVSMMTLHMAKGLEFPRVFIAGVEEGLLPHHNSLEDPDTLEEERRLFYVGMTRAKEKLSLASAYRRRTYNTWAANRPSRFLSEIPVEYFEPMSESEHRSHEVTTAVPYSAGESYHYEYDEPSNGRGSSAGSHLAVGQTVRHPTYGRGIVEQILDEFGVIKAVVRFAEFGQRKVMSRHLEV